MIKELTCILCPNGCVLNAEAEGDNITVTGHSCPKGKDYAIQELLAPMRTISSFMLVSNGEEPLVSVRLNRPIPRERIFDVMAEIKKQRLTAPVSCGQIIIANVLGLDSDVIATKSITAKFVRPLSISRLNKPSN